MIIENGAKYLSGTLAVDQAFDELLASLDYSTVSSYWTIRSKLLSLSALGKLTALKLAAFEFDLALKFLRAADVANSALKLHSLDKQLVEVPQRLAQLFHMITSDHARFTSELLKALPMPELLAMIENTYHKENAAKACLQILAAFAFLNPNSLAISAASFGNMNPQKVFQVFQLMLANCYEQTIEILPDNFYSIPLVRENTSRLVEPRQSWVLLARILAVLSARLNPDSLLHELVQKHSPHVCLPNTILEILDRVLASKQNRTVLKDTELLRLFIAYAFAHLQHLHEGALLQLVCQPANIFWVDSHALVYYWADNADPLETTTGAAANASPSVPLIRCATPPPGSVQPASVQSTGSAGEKPLAAIDFFNGSETVLESLKVLSQLFAVLFPEEETRATLFQVVDSFQQTHNLHNGYSLGILALMVAGHWRHALNLATLVLNRFNQQHPLIEQQNPLTEQQRQLLQLQQMQAFIALRELLPAFQQCFLSLAQWKTLANDEDSERMPIVISQAPSVMLVEGSRAVLDFLLINLFHVVWLMFARTRDDLLLSFLVLIVQSIWEPVGFGLFQQLCEHIVSKPVFNCAGLFPRLCNTALITQLLAIPEAKFLLEHEESGAVSAVSGTEIRRRVQSGERLFSQGGGPIVSVERFLADNQQRFVTVFSAMK